jgi:dihydropteroate synthase
LRSVSWAKKSSCLKSKVRAFSEKKTLRLGGRLLDLSSPVVMGILNLTPDSFYPGSRKSIEEVLSSSDKMLEAGVGLVDMGGYSSRPGAEVVSEEEELGRVIPAIALLLKHHSQALVSVDTFRARVAREAVAAGAVLVNVVSGGNLDMDKYDTVSQLGVPYVLMHMRGTPQNMATLNQYQHLFKEVILDLRKKIAILQEKGVNELLVDPGFGFAKNIEQNFEMLRHLEDFALLGFPLLVGLSRKSMVYKTLNTTPEDALNGSTVLHTVALEKGASILRVHDVKQAREAVQLVRRMLGTGNQIQ